MLSPRALALLLRYLDSIDVAVACRVLDGWDESALTHLFCEALGAKAEEGLVLRYTRSMFDADVEKLDEPLSLDWSISTRKFNPHEENKITQSDIGLIVKYRDQFEPNDSFEDYSLLQAKRVFPAATGPDGQLVFDLSSKFNSFNAAQHARMEILQNHLRGDALHYLLYCPRPEGLTTDVRRLLAHARTKALSGDIFDYALGQQLHADLMSDHPTTAAGVFVSKLDPFPENFRAVHREIFKTTLPFSWFIARKFDGRKRILHDAAPGMILPTHPTQPEWLKRLVCGDPDVTTDMGVKWPLAPRVTVTVRASYGTDFLNRPRR